MALWPLLRFADWPAYLATARISASSQLDGNFLFLIDYLLRLLRVALLIAVWMSLPSENGYVAGIAIGSLLAYTVIAEAFEEIFDARTEMTTTIWSGAIASRALQPMGFVGLYGSEAAGRWAVGFGAFSIPLIALANLVGIDTRPASVPHLAAFIVSVALAAAVGFAIEFAFAAISVIMNENLWVIDGVRNAFSKLLSGAVVPLALLPWGLGDILAWSPFAAMASSPLRIYLGSGDVAAILATQIAWAVVAWIVADLLWRRARENLAALGG
ncbi:MAG: hypothetical protein EPO26_05920 [Chloroflexota bacterium]|nr:MAG: hypothetical protein EPO26_05920 [Chloroflexota bacterium]